MNEKAGFTLIEILVALAVFAILATVTGSAMFYAFNTKIRVDEQANRLNDLQLVILLLERDIGQIVNRPIRAEQMNYFPALLGKKEYIEFTRAGMRYSPLTQNKSSLQRIAWFCKNHQLVRRHWVRLDIPQRKHYQDKIMLDNVKSCDFAYLNQSVQILSAWRENLLESHHHQVSLPKAIQFNLNLNDWGQGSFLFIVPIGLYEKITPPDKG